jgi:undecaprenyl-phosphate galactose phosphotransferase
MDTHRLEAAGIDLQAYLPKIRLRSPRVARDGMIFALTDLIVMALALVVGRLGNFVLSGMTAQETVVGWTQSRETLIAIQLYIVFCCALLVLFRRLGHYSRRRPVWQEIGDIISLCATAAVLHMAVIFLLKLDFSRVWLVGSWAAVAVGVPLSRILAKRLMLARGHWVRPTVVVGTGRTARDAARALLSDALLGYRIDAFVMPTCIGDDVPSEVSACGRSWPVVSADLEDGLLPEWFGRPHVTVALEMEEMARSGNLVDKLNFYYGDVDVVSPLRGVPLSNTRMTYFFGHDILALRLHNNLSRPWPQLLKRAFDLVVGFGLLVAVAPLMAVIACRLAFDDGPVIYGHLRVGCCGRLFLCRKFRTMVPDAERVLHELLQQNPEARAEWARDHKLKHDPRITRFGAWLRRTSLDELPQIWNVVRGDMSLVGPRPITRAELARYGSDALYYTATRPGLTGLWQVSGRNDTDYDERVHLDGWYVRNWSLWYDLVILAQTGLVVVRPRGAY